MGDDRPERRSRRGDDADSASEEAKWRCGAGGGFGHLGSRLVAEIVNYHFGNRKSSPNTMVASNGFGRKRRGTPRIGSTIE
jgi:hypothetical protein